MGGLWVVCDPAGRNACEARAGLVKTNADADPPVIWGRQHERGRKSSRAPARSAGV